MKLIIKPTLFFLFYLFFTTANAESIDVFQASDIQGAIDRSKPGDIIQIHEGEYILEAGQRIEVSGKTGITIQGADGDVPTVINGNNVSRPSNTPVATGLFHIEDSNHIVLSDIQIKHSNFAGFMVYDSSDITIQYSSSDGTYSSGIGVRQSSDIILKQNVVANACNGSGDGKGGEEAISIVHSDYISVIGNTVYDDYDKDNNAGRKIENNDVDNGTGGEGIDVKEGSKYVFVINNEVSNLYGRIGIYIDAWNQPTENIYVINNHVHHNGNAGISLASEKGGELSTVFIIDNEVHDNAFSGINVSGSFNNQIDTDEANVKLTSRHPPINNIKIQWNTLSHNGIGLCSQEILRPCDEKDKGLFYGDGGIAFGNPFSSRIKISNNKFINNTVKDETNYPMSQYAQINFEPGYVPIRNPNPEDPNYSDYIANAATYDEVVIEGIRHDRINPDALDRFIIKHNRTQN